MLNIINFAHGAQYMMGAFAAFLLLQHTGSAIGRRLIVAPILVGITRHGHRAHHAAMALQARSSLRAAADLRAGADHRGRRAQLLRLGRACPITMPESLRRRPQSRLHVPAELSRLGDRGFADGLPRHLVRDRAHEARLLSARRDRESDAGSRLRHQRAAHDHADLRLRRGARRLRRRDGGADLQRQPADGLVADHRRVRGGGDRRHGLDHGRDRHRLRPRRDRGADQGVLSRRPPTP